MAVKVSYKAGVLALTALLLACNNGEVMLQGDRVTPRAAAEGGTVVGADDAAALSTGATPVAIALPGQTSIEWTHRAGNVAHAPGNAAFSGAMTRVWTANIGRGDSRKNRITADPVVAGGRIFTLDSEATVTATGTNGGTLWQADLTPLADRDGDASGGGLAYGEGLVFATTGFGELIALNPGNGAVVWRQKFDVAVGGAPTVAGGKVFVVARDGSASAVGAKDGKIAWQIPGAPAKAGVAGASAPAISGDMVLLPYSSGQIQAVNMADGTPVWTGYVAGERLGRAFASYSDLTGDPVVVGGTIYAGTSAGRLAALDAATGTLNWSALDGAMSPVVVAGGSLFLATDEDQLMRYNAATGEVIWRVDMPFFTKTKDKKRRNIYAYFGPVLAGGRLIAASSDGVLQSFDPASGKLIGQVDLPGGAASAPVVSGGTLYVVSQSGQLHAFR
ncbi:MAG: PQQ-binding-like beta-propeller repeat protein [Paracoccaceae bacterium]